MDSTTRVPDAHCKAVYDQRSGYITNIEHIRSEEYPKLSGTVYLDHTGATLYPNSLIEAFAKELTSNVFGNPHSASASSQLSTRKIEDARLAALRFFNASPDDYDLIFTANATAAIKLVAELFRDFEPGFEYAYHTDSHTSLVGVRELAARGNSRCFSTRQDLMQIILHPHYTTPEFADGHSRPLLVAFPGQSNMTGQKFLQSTATDISQCKRQQCQDRPVYSLCDAAALAATSPLDFSNSDLCADFTALSFYKILGFPDLGALLVRKSCFSLTSGRRYFGGGTVDSVVGCPNAWHAKKDTSLHARLEDGTLPFHNILALGLAFDNHRRLFGPMSLLSAHIHYLSQTCRQRLQSLRHKNGHAVCIIYGGEGENDNGPLGPVISFNVLDGAGRYISCVEFEKLCIVRNIHIRTGGLCNPGGTARHLGLTSVDIQQHHASGYRCGGVNDIFLGKPTGTIRASFGASSSLGDVDTFIAFLEEFFVEKAVLGLSGLSPSLMYPSGLTGTHFTIECMSVYPIKSCAAFNIPPHVPWEVWPRGLMWDREWCLVHEGTLEALSQKRYPRMALIRPSIDLTNRLLHVDHDLGGEPKQLTIGLSVSESTKGRSSNVCGESLQIEHYTSPAVSSFFTEALGVPCTLARFSHQDERHVIIRHPGGDHLKQGQAAAAAASLRLISLSNESPILLISRSSVNKLNEDIKARGGGSGSKTVSAESFRANIIVSETLEAGQFESPYVEDTWASLSVIQEECGSSSSHLRGVQFEVLGPCQRCQVVCINQKTASRRPEPFSTLSKTRRRNGKVWFGMHICLYPSDSDQARSIIKVGDRVVAVSAN